MAINKIHEICLYTSDIMNPVECHAAKAWFDHSGINYRWLNYNSAAQLPEVTNALNTWWTGKTVAEWPFVVYRYEKEESPGIWVSDFIEGVDNIKDTLPGIVSSSSIPWV